MRSAERLHLAVVCGAAHLALCITIQIVCIAWYVPGHAGWYALPLLQTRNVLVAAALGLAAWAPAGGRRLRWAGVPVWLLAALYLMVDQVHYKIFLEHLRFAPGETSHGLNLGLLVRSLFHEWDAACTISAAVAAAGLVWVVRTVRAPARGRFDKAALAAAAVLVFAGIPVFSSPRYFGMNQHPLWSAMEDLSREDLAAVVGGKDVRRAAAPGPVEAGDRSPGLAALARASRETGRRNVILIVLESVGARNLLGGKDAPDPALTPNLAALAENGILFDNLYAPFPGTTRSWMGLLTGGGNVPLGAERDIQATYDGATLPRVFAQMGYSTAFFSGQPLDVELADELMAGMRFGTLYDFAKDPGRFDPGNRIHIWGALEEYALHRIDDWLGTAVGSGRPFLLEYATAATHYPYGAPPGYPAPLPRGEPINDYRNALNYTDHAIGELLDILTRRGLRQQTVIAVTGDHGEAFGDPHPGNVLHRERIYEENVRTFLLLSDPEVRTGRQVSHRVAGNGAILGTLAAWLGGGAHEPGLLAADFPERPVFFYKLQPPEQCGLRDGKWKYIGEIRSKAGELYDLAVDPEERVNVAEMQKDKMAAYRAACEEWMVSATRDYEAHLEGHQAAGSKQLRAADLEAPGPKLTAVGRLEGKTFTAADRFAAGDAPGVWTKWVDALDAPGARYEWIAPSGREYDTTESRFLEWDEAFSACPAPKPLAAGKWTVRVRCAGRKPLAAEFSVSPAKRVPKGETPGRTP